VERVRREAEEGALALQYGSAPVVSRIVAGDDVSREGTVEDDGMIGGNDHVEEIDGEDQGLEGPMEMDNLYDSSVLDRHRSRKKRPRLVPPRQCLQIRPLVPRSPKLQSRQRRRLEDPLGVDRRLVDCPEKSRRMIVQRPASWR
jgi:hypothetical protein